MIRQTQLLSLVTITFAFAPFSHNAWAAMRTVEECGIQYSQGYSRNCGFEVTSSAQGVVGAASSCSLRWDSNGPVYWETYVKDSVEWQREALPSVYENGHFICTIQTKKAKSCRLPQFGIEAYVACDIKKTTGELNEFISQNKVSIANDGKDLLQFQSNFYSEEKNQIAMGCLIANYQSDPIYSALATELKIQFQNSFNTVFDSSAFTSVVCSQAQATSIQSAICADSDLSSKCGNLRRYHDNLTLLQSKKAEILDLKNDVVPRQNITYAADLDNLIALMPQEARN